MTSTIEKQTGEWLPKDCPSWCDREHAVALAENPNEWAFAQAHFAAGTGECLSEITYAGRPCRPWGGGWDLYVEQEPLHENGGAWGPALIHLDAREPDFEQRVMLKLTSGEARVLARQLVAYADRVDL